MASRRLKYLKEMTERLISCNEPCPMNSVKGFFIKNKKSDKDPLRSQKNILNKSEIITN